jgi:hypothetical protein
MTRTVLASLCTLWLPVAALAQPARQIDLTASIAVGRVSRAEDRSFGTAFTPGAGIERRPVSRLGLGVEVSRVGGLDPIPLACGAPAGVSCTGGAREGVLDVTLLSGTAAWYIVSRGAIRPYVTGGVGVVRSRSLASVTYASPAGWTLQEREESDTGMGLTAGAGIRFLVGNHVVIRPEWHLYDGSIRGRANLSVMRTSVSVGYGW